MHILNKNGFAKLNTYIPFSSSRPRPRRLSLDRTRIRTFLTNASQLLYSHLSRKTHLVLTFFVIYFGVNPFLNLTNAEPNRIEETHHTATLAKILEITLILFDLSTSLIYAFHFIESEWNPLVIFFSLVAVYLHIYELRVSFAFISYLKFSQFDLRFV